MDFPKQRADRQLSIVLVATSSPQLSETKDDRLPPLGASHFQPLQCACCLGERDALDLGLERLRLMQLGQLAHLRACADAGPGYPDTACRQPLLAERNRL